MGCSDQEASERSIHSPNIYEGLLSVSKADDEEAAA